MTSFYFCKDLISEYTHILRYQVRTPTDLFLGNTIQPITSWKHFFSQCLSHFSFCLTFNHPGKTHFWCRFFQRVFSDFQIGLNAPSLSLPQIYPQFLYFCTYSITVRVIYVSYSNCETTWSMFLYSQDPVRHRMQSKACAKCFLHSVTQDTLTTWLDGQSSHHVVFQDIVTPQRYIQVPGSHVLQTGCPHPHIPEVHMLKPNHQSDGVEVRSLGDNQILRVQSS